MQTTHIIHFMDSNGNKVKRTYFSNDGLVHGLKKELKKIGIKRSITNDSEKLEQLKKAERSIRGILAIYDEKSEWSRTMETAIEKR